jgi:hypothetical protein
MAGMNMGIDEARANQFRSGIDDPINWAIESLAEVNDVFAFEHHDTIAQERMAAAIVSDDPLPLYQRSHSSPFLS